LTNLHGEGDGGQLTLAQLFPAFKELDGLQVADVTGVGDLPPRAVPTLSQESGLQG